MRNPIFQKTPTSSRAFRGGYWSTYPTYLHSFWRSNFTPSGRFYGIGFRIFRTKEKI